VNQVVNREPQTRSAPLHISIAGVAWILTVHADSLHRGLLYHLIFIHAFLKALIFVVCDEVEVIVSLALNAVVNVTSTSCAGWVALLALLLTIIAIGIVNLSFLLALCCACV
jgi:hypothetical protein